MRIDRGRRPQGGGCRLESGHTFTAGDDPSAGGAGLVVLMRVASGRVERVRAYTDDCVLDAEGRLVVWLEGVPPAESVALLKELLSDAARSEQIAEEALTALALHAAPEAVQALIDLARRHRNPVVREQAFFWLGESEDPRALAFFEEVLGR
jgi:HEAT repeat protein